MEECESDPRTRTLDVTLQGGAPWGFSVKGGSEHRCPLTIARIEAGGKARQSGVLEVDDIILSINNVECESHTEAIQLVKGSPSTLQLIIQRSGSDLHLRQTMKQTDHSKAPLQDQISPRKVRSTRIYDVQPPPSAPTYEKPGHRNEIKKSPDYDHPPSSKAAPGGVSRRLKKGEATDQPRPKSWHNVEASQTWEEPAFKKSPKPVAQPLQRPTPQIAPHHQALQVDPSLSMDSLPVMQTFQRRTMPHSNTKSMINLQGFKDETELGVGFVKKRVSDYISSSNRELSSSGKDKDFYFVNYVKRGPLIPYNPKFKDVELQPQPAETYPKVASAKQLESTQLQSAQQRAFIGRVPDVPTSPESQPQKYNSSQVVSYLTVQMPQRHYASTIELGGKYWDEKTNSHPQGQGKLVSPTSGPPVYQASPKMSLSPTPSDKREPPTPPQRVDSRNRTHQMSEHMKSSSWPVPTSDTQEPRRNDNNCTPSSIISPTDIPPVKLCPEQVQPRPNHSNSYSMTGDSEPYGGEPIRSTTMSSPVYSSQLQGNRKPTGSETFPGMNNKHGNQQEYLFTAQPCYVDPGSDSPETDTKSWFPSSSPQNVPEKQQSSYEYQPRGSPPTRDNVDRITEEEDPLVSALQSYMQTVLDQEDCLQGVNPESSSTGSESPTHQPHNTPYYPSGSDYNRPHSQTLPAYVARNEKEKRSSRTSVSSLDSHSSSNHRVKSPTNRLSSDEEEQNRKNSQLGNTNQRTWKNPNDFSNKKPVIDTEKQWQEIVLTADPTWGEKYTQADVSSAPKSQGHVRSSSQIDEKLIRGNAPGIRSPISPLMMEAVTIEHPQPETITEAQQKEIKFLKTEGRDSGYEVDAENPFRAQQDSPNHVHNVADTFSSEDWMKLDKVESTGGTSILSQLQRETPFSQRYIKGEPIKSTVNHETKVEIKIDRSYSSPTNESRRQQTRPETTTTQSWNSRPQPVYQPKSKEMKSPTGQISKDSKNSFFGSQPQLSRQTASDTSSRHYHSSSLDLDTKVTGPQVQSSCPPCKPEVSDEPSSGVSHSRSHSYSGGFYPSYPGQSEPRFSRIDEEQGVESSESGPGSRISNNQDRRSVSGTSAPRSYGSYDRDAKDHRRSTSDPNSTEPPIMPIRKTSFERGKYPKGDSDVTSQHQYSKSDSERHRKNSAADQCHKISDPSGAIRKSHRASDPEDKKNIKDALMNFCRVKKGPQRSEGSVFGSQQGSLSDYASMQSIDQFSSQYSSMSSLHGTRGGVMDSFDHSRQSSYSSQTSHAHRDSGIVSPSESSWGPLSPNTSPPGVMDHRQRGQQRASGSDNGHQRTSSDSTSPVERIRDGNLQGKSWTMLDDSRPVKNSVKVTRSVSMSQPPSRRPVSFPDPRDRYTNRDDSSKSLSRTETFSLGQKQSGSHNRQSSHLSATLPSTGYHDNNAKQHWASKEGNQWYPTKAAPSSQSFPEMEINDDVPPELPPKQIKEAQLKTIAKVEQRQPEGDGTYRAQEREPKRKVSAPARYVFKFPSPICTEQQQRYPAPKTPPALSTSQDTSPSNQATTGPRTQRSPSLPISKDASATQQATSSPRTRTSPSLPPSKEASPTHQASPTSPTRPRTQRSPSLPVSKEASLTHQATPSPRPRTESFDLPPPPTPPAVPVTEDIRLVGDLPSPPPEVLDVYSHFQRKDKTVVEELVSRRRAESTHAAVSYPQAKPDPDTVHTSPSVPPYTFSSHSQVTTEERLPVSVDPDIAPEVKPRSESEAVVATITDHHLEDVLVDPSCDINFDVTDGSDISDTPSSQSRITASPINQRPALDLELDDEVGPIEVVEIIHTPTLSPKRGENHLPGHEGGHSQDPVVDWVLHSLNPQDFALRELFQFPDEPYKVGSLSYKKMPHEKNEEAQTPKRSECDVKSLTNALSSSMYLQISPAKALLLTRAKSMMGSDMVQGDSKELRKTKEELISRIGRKVSELSKEKHELQEEITNIEDLGRQVTENVTKSCKSSSVDKYVMFIGDAERVTKLLLSLSRRLTKVNSVLNSLEGNDEEEQKVDLQKMHKDLTSKYEDAKGLKVSIDARHVQISSMLQDHLSTEEYEDFCHFVPMRSRLRIMAQELDDRITLGEEQLQALRESIKGERSQGEESQCSSDSS